MMCNHSQSGVALQNSLLQNVPCLYKNLSLPLILLRTFWAIVFPFKF